MDFSIHTFEITYRSNCANYYRLYKAVNHINQSQCPQKEFSFLTPGKIKLTYISQSYVCLNQKGINRIYFYKLQDKALEHTVTYGIKFIVNPKILLGYTDYSYTEIIKSEDLPRIPNALNQLLQELVPGYPDISEQGKITRIDYCTNLWFQSTNEADEYFHILKKYFTPAKFRIDTFYDCICHRKSPRKGEISLSCKSYTLSIYQKQNQLIQSTYHYPSEDIENACGQLRIELRLKRPKLYSIKNTFLIKNECDLFIQIPPSVLTTLLKKLSVMYGTGDFFRLSEARQLISYSQYQRKTISSMLEILDNVNESRTLNCYNTDYKKKTLKKQIEKFNDLGISPITLPSRSIHRTYPNLISYIIGETADYLKIKQ